MMKFGTPDYFVAVDTAEKITIMKHEKDNGTANWKPFWHWTDVDMQKRQAINDATIKWAGEQGCEQPKFGECFNLWRAYGNTMLYALKGCTIEEKHCPEKVVKEVVEPALKKAMWYDLILM